MTPSALCQYLQALAVELNLSVHDLAKALALEQKRNELAYRFTFHQRAAVLMVLPQALDLLLTGGLPTVDPDKTINYRAAH